MVSPVTLEDITFEHAHFLDTHVTTEAVDYLMQHAHELQEGVGSIGIQGFLRPHAVEELGMVLGESYRGGGRIIFADATINLMDFMLDMSRLYISKHSLLTPHATIKPMSYNPDEPKFHTLVPRHHDWKDGNAVLYNWDVEGDHVYHIGDTAVHVDSNQLVVLNGDSRYLTSRDAYGTQVHSVEPVDGATQQELESLARNRVLVFWDGVPTDITMVPPELN